MSKVIIEFSVIRINDKKMYCCKNFINSEKIDKCNLRFYSVKSLIGHYYLDHEFEYNNMEGNI